MGKKSFQNSSNFLNKAHHSIKITAEWSKEEINFLDVRVIREGTKLITDLCSKPTDTHQFLHRTSCHSNHTKKGTPYSQALRIRRICSEDGFFDSRVTDLKSWLLDRGYTEGDINGQVNMVKGLDRTSILFRQQQSKDDIRIPLVVTYHPALHEVHEVLRQSQNILFADTEHRNLFKDKIFVSFRKAKSLKDNLVRAKLQPIEKEVVEKGTLRCKGRKNCQICPLIREGDTFTNANDTRTFKIFSGQYHCNTESVVYMLQCDCCNKKYIGSTKNKFRQRFNV